MVAVIGGPLGKDARAGAVLVEGRVVGLADEGERPVRRIDYVHQLAVHRHVRGVVAEPRHEPSLEPLRLLPHPHDAVPIHRTAITGEVLAAPVLGLRLVGSSGQIQGHLQEEGLTQGQRLGGAGGARHLRALPGPPDRDKDLAVHLARGDLRAGGKVQRLQDRRFGALPVPTGLRQPDTRGVARPQVRRDREDALIGPLHFLARRHHGLGHQQLAEYQSMAKAAPGQGELGIERERLPIELGGARHAGRSHLQELGLGPKVQIVGRDIPRAARGDYRLADTQGDSERLCDLARDLVLDGEHVVKLSVVGL